MQKNQKKTLYAWAMYDWANSAHNLVITSAIFPAYFASITKENKGLIDFFGYSIKNSVLFSYAVSLGFLSVVLLHPLLSALADFTGRKKDFMRFFVYLGAFSTCMLSMTTQENIIFSLFWFVLSLIGYSGSLVFYNAFLPEIATEDKFDYWSAKGYMLGYVGSVLLMIQNLTMLEIPSLYGNISNQTACQISFLSVGIWWWFFGEYTLQNLPNQINRSTKNWLKEGFLKIKKTYQNIKQDKKISLFLIGFFCYNMGLQTIMYIAAIFAEVELKIPESNLIITILLIQLLAIVGAYFFAYLSDKTNNIYALKIGIFCWTLICMVAYFITPTTFYFLAIVIGFVMGGIQALSRSTFTKLMPDTEDKSSYFGIYEVTDKLGTVVGTFSFGLIEHLSGNVRNSIAVLTLYFLVGFLFLWQIKSMKK
ncbi:MAG: MFS transporter [Bacteroidetes bacterium]|nr:MAG: MFS transporter [Bacteroidota bacterium]TAG87466.1 MAG: MFS transporter [Bacteroidota bacterium]